MDCPICGAKVPAGALVCPVCGTPLNFSLPLQALPAGTLLHGKYRIDRLLGQGGFGITYAATQTQLGFRVAVKELFPEGALRRDGVVYPPGTLGPERWQQVKSDFTAEARTLARFSHPGIVRVLDLFEDSGTAYMVMELLSGETLQARINRLGPLAPGEAQQLAVRVTQALKEVHAAGLLHRDLKPGNIFLEDSGRIVLIDFGSARDYQSGQTVQHTRMVTPGYAPLEQYGHTGRFGPYTDIYALGATLYHAVTGKVPPDATDLMNGQPLPPLPPSTPPGLRAAIQQAMSVRVADRPQDADALLRLLQSSLNVVMPSAAQTGQAPATTQTQRRSQPQVPVTASGAARPMPRPVTQAPATQPGGTQPAAAQPPTGQPPVMPLPASTQRPSRALWPLLIGAALLGMLGFTALQHTGRVPSQPTASAPDPDSASGEPQESPTPAIPAAPGNANGNTDGSAGAGTPDGGTETTPTESTAPVTPVPSETPDTSTAPSPSPEAQTPSSPTPTPDQTTDSTTAPKTVPFAITSPASDAEVPTGAFDLTGQGTPGDTLQVMQDGAALGSVTVAASGQWTFRVPGPAAGSHTYLLNTADGHEAGRVSLTVLAPPVVAPVTPAPAAPSAPDAGQPDSTQSGAVPSGTTPTTPAPSGQTDGTAPAAGAAAGNDNTDSGDQSPNDADADNAIDDAEVQNFVTQYLSAEAQATSAASLRMYADQVDYFDRGPVSKSVIAQDKQNYFARWPSRRYTLTSGIQTISSTASERVIRFDYRYDLTGREKLSGAAFSVLRLAKTGGALLITSEQGKTESESGSAGSSDSSAGTSGPSGSGSAP